MAKVSSKPKVAQGSRPGEAQKPKLVKLKIAVDSETAKVIRIEAFGRGVSLGQVVSEGMALYPRQFVFYPKVKGSQGTEGQAHEAGQRASVALGPTAPLTLVSEAG